MNTFIEWMKMLMNKKGINQKKLAELLDVTESQISNWLNAKYIPRIQSIEKMLDNTGYRLEIVQDKETKETTEPEIEGDRWSWFWVCGECHGQISENAEVCPHCGWRLKWDGQTETD